MKAQTVRALRRAKFAVAAVTLAAGATPGVAQTVSYADKTVTIVHNTPPAGTSDTFTRQIGPYLVKHLPGEPKFITVAKPGGQFLLGAAHMHKNVDPDGLTIGMLATLPGQVATRVKLPFDLSEFVFAGGMGQPYAFYARKDLGIATADQLARPPNKIIMGSAAPNTNTNIMWRLFMNAVSPAGSYQQIFGLQGQTGQLKALRSNDINMASMLTTLFLQMRPGLEKEGITVTLFETGNLDNTGAVVPTPALGVPTIDQVWRKLSPHTVDTKEFRAYRLLLTTIQLTHVFVLPPGTPKAHADAWEKALSSALKEKDYLAEMEKIGTIVPDWASAEATRRGIAAIRKAADDPEYQAALEPVFLNR
jgi:tripartite-type tricarboxylate transporter receptor subunit TctC